MHTENLCLASIYRVNISPNCPFSIPISRNQMPNGTPIIGKPEDASQ